MSEPKYEHEFDWDDNGPTAGDVLADNERMGDALVQIGMALGLPRPTAQHHWGTPEILDQISKVWAKIPMEPCAVQDPGPDRHLVNAVAPAMRKLLRRVADGLWAPDDAVDVLLGWPNLAGSVPDTGQDVFEQHPGTDARTFLQWKGTDVCIDVRCTCGAKGHLDGDFAYFVECPACGAVYEMGTAVKAIKLPAETEGEDYDAKLLDVPDPPADGHTTALLDTDTTPEARQ